jgi:hypothetical protein
MILLSFLFAGPTLNYNRLVFNWRHIFYCFYIILPFVLIQILLNLFFLHLDKLVLTSRSSSKFRLRSLNFLFFLFLSWYDFPIS